MPVPKLAIFALALIVGYPDLARAEPYGFLGYPLGMSFDDFLARPIPESSGKKNWRILCADGREMHGRMMGFIGADHDIETRVGAKTCVFAEPDLISGPKWWKPAAVAYAGKPMIWFFRFLSDPRDADTRRLFAITALYRPEWAYRNEPIDAVEPALIDAFGAGEAVERKKLTGRVWHDGGQTAEFATRKLLGSVQQAEFCIGIVDEAGLGDLNRRLEPFRRQHWTVCLPQSGRGAAQHD